MIRRRFLGLALGAAGLWASGCGGPAEADPEAIDPHEAEHEVGEGLPGSAKGPSRPKRTKDAGR